MLVREGELTLSGKTGAIRARCGNRLSETPQEPTVPVTAPEPTADDLEKTGPEETEVRPAVTSVPAKSPSAVKTSNHSLSRGGEQPGTTPAAGSAAAGIYAAGGPGFLAPIGGSIFPPPGTVPGSAADGLMMPPPDSAGAILIVTIPGTLTFPPGRGGTGAPGTGVAAPIILSPGSPVTLKPGSPVTAQPTGTAEGLRMPSPSGGNAGNFPTSPTGGEDTPIYIPTENVSVEGGLTPDLTSTCRLAADQSWYDRARAIVNRFLRHWPRAAWGLFRQTE